MKARKNIVKFTDFIISTNNTEFGVSKVLLDTSSCFFKTIFEQTPDIGSYKLDINVKDSAVEFVLQKVHRVDVEIKNEDVTGCLELVLKWDVIDLKQAFLIRQIKLLDADNLGKVMGVAKKYECIELIDACSKITPKDGVFNSPINSDIREIKENIGKLYENVKKLDENMKKHDENTEKRFAVLESKMASLENSMQKILTKLEQESKKEEEKKIIKKPVENGFWRSSKIINKEEVILLKEWTRPNEKAKVRFELLYQGSKNGYTVGAFHGKCDNMGPTITVVESHLGKKFGGYTTISWTSSSSGVNVSDTKSFTFSLTNKMQCLIQDSSKYGKAVYHYSACGPRFGEGADFSIYDNCNLLEKGCYSNGNATYKLPAEVADPKTFYAGAYNFAVKEIEVYKVDIIYNYFKKK